MAFDKEKGDACCTTEQPTSSIRDKGNACIPRTGPPREVEPPATTGCADACCAGKKLSSSAVNAGDDCCSGPDAPRQLEHSATGGCASACNSGSNKSPVAPRSKENSSISPEKTCERAACSSSDKGKGKAKKTKCCDERCLDELALRKCDEDDCSLSGRTVSSACDFHKRKTRSKYSESLEALGCICRALLARNLESCCTKSATLRRRRRSPRAASPESYGHATGVEAIGSGCKTGGSGAKASCRAACCSKPPIIKKRPGCQKGCCGGNSNSKGEESASSGDDCYATKHGAHSSVKHDIDLERRLTNDQNEHVVFTVHGMTCTGCETKLMRSLSAFPGVTRPQTSLLLSRAEFDLDLSVLSAEQAQARLEKETGFNFDKVANDGEDLETIEVLAPGNAKAFAETDMPPGVVSVSVVDGETVALQYDPKILGARKLVNSFGAPLQLAPLRPPPSISSGRKHVWTTGLKTALSALLTIPVLVMAWAPLPELEVAYGSASLALASIIQVAVAGRFYSSAVRSLVFSRVIEMDLLIVLSTTAAYVFSVVAFAYLVAGKPLSTGEFFETGTLLVTLIMVGRFLSALARQKAVESVSVRSLQASTALLSPADEEIDTRLLQLGDVFKVLPETRVPTDGTVVSGNSEVDESMITGEANPVTKTSGDSLIAGSINGSGVLLARVTRLPGSNTVAKIAAMVDEAKMSKPKIQDLADKVASWFVPVIVAITALVFVVWIGVGIGRDGMGASDAAVQAITYAIATLIVSCPCAIGLAVPMVIVMASGIAAENGVVAKSAETLEVARKASHVVFDKTGTLTQGKLSVAREVILEDPSVSMLFGLVRGSKHPVSMAIATHFEEKGIVATTVDDVQSVSGKGVEAFIDGKVLRAGNCRWLNVEAVPEVKSLLSQGLTVFCFTVNNVLHAAFGLADTLRPEAKDIITNLQDSAIDVSIVSGDDDLAVRSVASALSIPPTNVRSRASPADKQSYIQHLLADLTATVLFVGDGTNDSVALAQATIGVHMSGGTDVAAAAADAVLTADSLSGLLVLLRISQSAFRRICANFVWSFVYNVFAILLAAGAFPNGVRIPPQFAGLGEVVSVLPVIAIAVHMKFTKRWT
ncbi:E1-E2 ATPase-domain-containing protein [Phyllosticta capitalensis]|uniref:E1-E2 ATPase-domain-containing protein n=1 Tax=Phyllosticta capitalensis TaxID=121624 RepID=UPI00312F0256